MKKQFKKLSSNKFNAYFILVVFLGVILTGCAHSPKIAEYSTQSTQLIAENFLKAMDEAYVEKNVGHLANLLHDDFNYKINARQQGGPVQEMNLTKRVWMNMLSQQLKSISNYTIERYSGKVFGERKFASNEQLL